MGRITEADARWISEFYPSLRVRHDNALTGHLRFRAAYKGKSNGELEVFHGDLSDRDSVSGEILEDVYRVHVVMKESDPMPLAWELSGRLKMQAESMRKSLADLHMYENNESLCLGNPVKIRANMMENDSVQNYFERWLIPYLYYRSYLEKFSCEPWPGLPHGLIGILEDFSNLDGIGTDSNILKVITNFYPSLLQKVSASDSSKDKYRANDRCICGSEIKFKRCHPQAWLGYKNLREIFQRKTASRSAYDPYFC